MDSGLRVLTAVLLTLGCASEPIADEEMVAGCPGPDPRDATSALGEGDGSSGSVTFTPVYTPGIERQSTGLAFNPTVPDELWVTVREPDFADELPCTMTEPDGCAALVGRMAVISEASGSAPSAELRVDDNGWHFLRNPSGVAFGTGALFATCGEARTANFTDEPVPYNGPVLWDSELFGGLPAPGQNGLHLDMLHETPYCMGIAHEVGNIYWVFNGDAGSVDRYDFSEPHVPGGEDHSDGALWRYVEGELSRDPTIPSHLDYDEATGWLYVADTGHGRVVRIDTKSGTPGADVIAYDPIAVHQAVDGAALEEVVPPGTLERPSGLSLHEGALFVGDNASGEILAFSTCGELLRTLATGLGPGELGGLAVSPDGQVFFSNLRSGAVERVDPT